MGTCWATGAWATASWATGTWADLGTGGDDYQGKGLLLRVYS